MSEIPLYKRARRFSCMCVVAVRSSKSRRERACLPERQGQILALTALCVPSAREIGTARTISTLHSLWVSRLYRGTSLIRKRPPPWDHHTTLDSPTVGSSEGGGSYERSTPVRTPKEARL